jgi:division protein CdvB (Snf7/Vps24/ESCRT-III family)
VVPFTTAFYNLGAMIGVYPEIEVTDNKKLHHHLRYSDPAAASMEAGQPSSDSGKTAQDAVQERRRAKAMKVNPLFI